MTDACIVMTTTADETEAHDLARRLVEEHLAACVQITPVTSHYRWDGDVQRSTEHLLLIKTTSDRYDDVESFVTREHSYDVPEVLGVPVTRGAPSYLTWLGDATATA